MARRGTSTFPQGLKPSLYVMTIYGVAKATPFKTTLEHRFYDSFLVIGTQDRS